MKVDETFESINRIWQEISVIVVLHAVALTLAVFAQIIPIRFITEGIRTLTSLPELTHFRENLQHIGLDLPIVVGVGVVVYVVLFQRISAAVIQIPIFRLSYSQPALWRAGKCFDELVQLVSWFEGYTASTELNDLEVTLELAIAQSIKDYEDHYRQLVGARLSAAALWARYYSGFCLLAFITIILVWLRPTTRGFLLPAGLLIAALIVRCGWEAQIEHAVLGRLHFAINCAIISGAKREASKNEVPEREEVYDPRNPEAVKRLELRVDLAASLMEHPVPYLPYSYFWMLHFVRQLRPFKNLGALALVPNDVFREWFKATHLMMNYTPQNEQQIDCPKDVPDDRYVARLLRRRWPMIVAGRLFGRVFLIDALERYRLSEPADALRVPPSQSFKKFVGDLSKFRKR